MNAAQAAVTAFCIVMLCAFGVILTTAWWLR